MELTLYRFSGGTEATLGLLFLDGTFECYVLEDQQVLGPVKVKGETRIPEGKYNITLRTEGGMHPKYQERFPFHRGMLWLQDVPNFEWIYIHVGNDDDDTEGCLIVGDGQFQNITEKGRVVSSVSAYSRIYPPIAEAIGRGEGVCIKVMDISQAKQ